MPTSILTVWLINAKFTSDFVVIRLVLNVVVLNVIKC